MRKQSTHTYGTAADSCEHGVRTAAGMRLIGGTDSKCVLFKMGLDVSFERCWPVAMSGKTIPVKGESGVFSKRERVYIYGMANLFLPVAFSGCLTITKIVGESNSPFSSISFVFSVFLLIFACDLFFVMNNRKYGICQSIPSVTRKRVVITDGICLSVGLVALWVYLFLLGPELGNPGLQWWFWVLIICLELPTMLTNKKIWKAIEHREDMDDL